MPCNRMGSSGFDIFVFDAGCAVLSILSVGTRIVWTQLYVLDA